MPSHKVFWATLILLLLLNIGAWQLRDLPFELQTRAPAIPWKVGSWQGEALPLLHNEQKVLAPAVLTSRAYRQPNMDKMNGQTLWLNALQSNSTGHMHNFYDSLLASGNKPETVKNHRIQTRQGALNTTFIRYRDPRGRTYAMLLWYQWPGGSAANRWQWYVDVLRLRLNRQSHPWQLVQIAVLVRQPKTQPSQSVELMRLEQFARTLFEMGQAP